MPFGQGLVAGRDDQGSFPERPLAGTAVSQLDYVQFLLHRWRLARAINCAELPNQPGDLPTERIAAAVHGIPDL